MEFFVAYADKLRPGVNVQKTSARLSVALPTPTGTHFANPLESLVMKTPFAELTIPFQLSFVTNYLFQVIIYPSSH
jgi:hypothetical protein